MDDHVETPLEAKSQRADQRSAMLRVFGGTALAFLALAIVALLVRPDLMTVAMHMVGSMMP